MDEKKLIFVYNPRSGKGMIRQNLSDIIDIFVKNGFIVTVYPTQSPEDAMKKIPQMAEYFDYIVCSGGDGTLNEVVTGMMGAERKRSIGYIPAGSTNDFASSLHIPKNMLKAAQIAVEGQPCRCDIGRFNEEKYFVYVAAFGLFTDVSYQTNQNMKNALGHAAYLLEGVKRLYDIPAYTMRIEVNGEVLEGDYVYGMISNSESVGGMKGMSGDDVLLDDGQFEVTLIQMPLNPMMLNDILASLLMPRLSNSRYVYNCKTDHIEFYCEEYVPWTRDGEFGGNHKKVVIDNLHRQMSFVIPTSEEDTEDRGLPLTEEQRNRLQMHSYGDSVSPYDQEL